MLKRFLPLLLLTAGFAFAGEPDAVRASSLRSGACTIHHVRLQTATAYEFAPLRPATFDPSASAYRLHAKYPNCLPLGVSFEKDEDFRKPVTVRYCPVCQKRYMARVTRD